LFSSPCPSTATIARCIRAATAGPRRRPWLKRCERGDAPKARCADWAYDTEPPIVPVKGATTAQLETSLAEVAGDDLGGDTRVAGVACTAGLSCTVTFVAKVYGEMRLRYQLTSFKQKPGCWYSIETEEVGSHLHAYTWVPETVNNLFQCNGVSGS
jgi:hypothetical protein